MARTCTAHSAGGCSRKGKAPRHRSMGPGRAVPGTLSGQKKKPEDAFKTPTEGSAPRASGRMMRQNGGASSSGIVSRKSSLPREVGECVLMDVKKPGGLLGLPPGAAAVTPDEAEAAQRNTGRDPRTQVKGDALCRRPGGWGGRGEESKRPCGRFFCGACAPGVLPGVFVFAGVFRGLFPSSAGPKREDAPGGGAFPRHVPL